MAQDAICLFKINYLGDAVTFLPTVRGVRDAYPDAAISIVCSSATAALYIGTFANIRAITVARESANGLKALRHLPRLCLEAGFRASAVALLSNDEPSLALLLAGFAARRRIGFDQAPARLRPALSDVLPVRAGRNVVDINFDLVRALTGNPSLMPKRTPIGFTEADRDVVVRKLAELGIRESEPFALFHPFGKKRYQMWGADQYRAVAERLVKSGVQCVFLCGSPNEQAEVDKAVMGISVNQVAALSGMARVFVGSNSGPMHVAAAMGTACVVVQGATAREWDIYWDDTPHTHVAATEVSCVPCERFGHVTYECTNYASPMACMAAISVDRVLQETTRLLNRDR